MRHPILAVRKFLSTIAQIVDLIYRVPPGC